jgi:hypothetical protein
MPVILPARYTPHREDTRIPRLKQAAARLPPATNHYSFSVETKEELESWKQKWRAETAFS